MFKKVMIGLIATSSIAVSVFANNELTNTINKAGYAAPFTMVEARINTGKLVSANGFSSKNDIFLSFGNNEKNCIALGTYLPDRDVNLDDITHANIVFTTYYCDDRQKYETFGKFYGEDLLLGASTMRGKIIPQNGYVIIDSSQQGLKQREFFIRNMMEYLGGVYKKSTNATVSIVEKDTVNEVTLAPITVISPRLNPVTENKEIKVNEVPVNGNLCPEKKQGI